MVDKKDLDVTLNSLDENQNKLNLGDDPLNMVIKRTKTPDVTVRTDQGLRTDAQAN